MNPKTGHTAQLRAIGLLTCCFLVPALATAQSAGPKVILVCYPGGPVDAKDASGAMDSMLRVVEKLGKWKSGSLTSQFTSKVDECRDLLAKKKPSFSILSLGLYLEHKDKYQLVPVVQPRIQGRSTEVYRVLAAKGKYKSVDELKGKTMGGTPLVEPEFLHRIVFAGRLDPASDFDIKPSNQPLKALRALSKGELEAVIVTEQQYAGVAALPFADQLAVVFASDPIPLMGIVADGRATQAAERARFSEALAGMCLDPDGKKMCDLFGVESFVPVSDKSYDDSVTAWNSAKKK